MQTTLKKIIDNDINVEQTLLQDAIAEIIMGDIEFTNSLNNNTLKGGSQININNSQVAGDAIATNNGSNNSTINNDLAILQEMSNEDNFFQQDMSNMFAGNPFFNR